MSRQNICLLWSIAWHRLTTFRRPLPILHIIISWTLPAGEMYQRLRSRTSPACSTSSAGRSMCISAQVQQPSLLNIDLHSTVREQQVQTSNLNIYGQVQSRPEYTLNTYKHLNCHAIPPQHKRVLNKEQFEVKPLTNLRVNPTTGHPTRQN